VKQQKLFSGWRGACPEERRRSIFQSKNDPEIDFRFQYKMILKI
jgi:hypothetical protein